MLVRKLKGKVTLEQLYECRPSYIYQYIRTENIGFWAICGYLFFEYVRPQSIYTVIDIFPWPSAFLSLSFFCALKKSGPVRQGNPVNKMIGIYGFVIILSAVFAINPSLAFGNLDTYWLWVMAYFAIVRLVDSRERFFIFLLLYLLCSFKMSQHGFISWAMRGFSFSGWGVTGSPGWFRNSGEFGIQLTLFVPLSIAFVFALREYWGRLFKLFFYAMPFTGVGSVVATSSRGALMGLLAAALWGLRGSKYFFRALIGLIVLCALIFAVIPDEFKSRFETVGDDRTSTHRLDRWGKAWDATLKRPLLGYGHKNWERYYRSHLDSGQRGSAMVHNIFIESLTEHGFIGVSCLISLIIYMFWLGRETRKIAVQKNMPFERLISYGMDAGLIGLIVSASFITVLYYPYLWISAALVSCLYNTTVQAAEPDS